jgi:hypothetical protein
VRDLAGWALRVAGPLLAAVSSQTALAAATAKIASSSSFSGATATSIASVADEVGGDTSSLPSAVLLSLNLPSLEVRLLCALVTRLARLHNV